MKEKALSLLLALAMALAVLPLSASADDAAQAPDARAPSCEREENAAVRSAATGQGFADLASAAAQAAGGDTLVLQSDLILYEPLVLEKTITIDGGGHAIYGTGLPAGSEAGIQVKDGAVTLKNMTLTDFSSASVDSVVRIDSGSTGAVLVADGLTVLDFSREAFTFKAGAFEVRNSVIDCRADRFSGSWLTKGFQIGSGDDPVTGLIENTTIYNDASLGGWSASSVEIGSNADVTMKGGLISGGANGILVDTYWAESGGDTTLVVDGTVIDCFGYALSTYGGEDPSVCTTVTIEDGRFIGTIAHFSPLEGDSLVIRGGSFAADVSEFLAPGLILVQGGDGMYTVQSRTPAAMVDGREYYSLDEALAALPSAADKTIILLADAELERMLDLNVEGMTLDLNGRTVSAAAGFSSDDERAGAHLINISADDVTLKNGVVKTGAANRHGVNLYQVSGAVLQDLTLDHTDAAAGAPLTVNASAVTVKGGLALMTGPASWYGIGLDPGGKSAALTFAENAAVTMTGESAAGLDVIRLDGDRTLITVAGAEEAGLVRTGENSYGFAPAPTPTPSATPAPSASPAPSPTPSPSATATPRPDTAPAPSASSAPAPETAATPQPTGAPLPTATPGPVTASVEAQVEDGKAVAQVDRRAFASAVSRAIARAAEGEGPAVTLELEAEGASALEVSMPAGPLAELAAQEGASLTVASPVADVTFDSAALSSIAQQAGEDLVLAVSPVDGGSMNEAQAEAAGDFAVTELTLESEGAAISDFSGGCASVTLPHDLDFGLNPDCVVVWYLDEEGGVTPCDTLYNAATDEVTFSTGHFSKYVVAYDESLLPETPRRPSYSLPEDKTLRLMPFITLAGVAVVVLVFLSLLVQLLLTGRRDKWRR